MNDASATEYAAPPGPRHTPSVRRDTENKMWAGVCAGLATAMDVDAVWVRLAVVAAGLSEGFAVLVGYVVAIFVIPEAKSRGELRPAPPRVAQAMRIGLGVVAAISLLDVFEVGESLGGPGAVHLFPVGFGSLLGAVLLIGAGVWLVRRHEVDDDDWFDDDPGEYRPTPSDVRPAGRPGPVTDEPPARPDLDEVDPLTDTFLEDLYGPLPAPAAGSRGDRDERGDRGERRLTVPLILLRIAGWVGLLWFVAACVVTGVLWTVGVAEVRWPAAAIALCLFAALGAPSALRRARVARPLAGALLMAAVAAVLAGNLASVPGAFGDVTVRPPTGDDVRSSYRMAFGSFVLDLSDTDFDPAERERIDIRMGGGELAVYLPADAAVKVTGRMGGGEMMLLGATEEGANLRRRESATARAEAAPAIELSVRMGGGRLHVSRSGMSQGPGSPRSAQPA